MTGQGVGEPLARQTTAVMEELAIHFLDGGEAAMARVVVLNCRAEMF